MLWKRLRVLGSVAHYHPKCQSGTSALHLDSVSVPVGKICIIRIVFQSLKVIAKGFYMGEHLSSNWNRQSIYLYPGPRGFLLFFIGKFCDANRFFYFCCCWHEALRAAKRKPLVETVGNLTFMPSAFDRRF